LSVGTARQGTGCSNQTTSTFFPLYPASAKQGTENRQEIEGKRLPRRGIHRGSLVLPKMAKHLQQMRFFR